MIVADARFVSPIAREGVLGADLGGRAQVVDLADLREDFASAVRHTMTEGETIEKILAVRPNRTGGAVVPASLILATNRALIYLYQASSGADASYGVRSRVIPYRAIVAVELGLQLLRGTFSIRVLGGTHVTVPSFGVRDQSGTALDVYYHTLDDRLFVDLLRDVRRLADL